MYKTKLNCEIFLPATPRDIAKYYHIEKCPEFIFTDNNCNCYPYPYLDQKRYRCNC